MKLKLDGNGNAILKDGKPVYIKESGEEVAFDAAAATAKISELIGEAKQNRLEAKEAKEKLVAFTDIDPEAARKALVTVKNLDDKKLIDAGEVDKVKAGLSASYEAKIKALTDENEGLNRQIYGLEVSGRFAGSMFLKEKTVIPPDMAEAYFSKNFKKDEKGRWVGHDANGNPIYSTSKPGEPADFEEAISAMVNSHPMKAAILRGSGASGSGAQNNTGSGAGHSGGNSLKPIDKIKAGLAEMTK